MAKEHATEFEKIINAGRERKKNEALAARIFKRDSARRSSAPSAGSLAGRVGVKKRLSSTTRLSAGDINGEWTHDLHNGRGKSAKAQDPNSLAARIHAPGTTVPKPRGNLRNVRQNRTSQLANAYERTTSTGTARQQMNVRPAPTQPSGQGITIRGLAGPFAVMAQNFAPGTTAADIESAMTPVGGLVSECRLVKTHPIVIAEIVFESKEGADRVIQTFNNQTADGRTLHVYMKPGGTSRPAVPTGPRAQRDNETRSGGNNVVVDGSMGFDLMETDTPSNGHSNGGLYSDNMVPKQERSNGNNNRRGRGFRTGR